MSRLENNNHPSVEEIPADLRTAPSWQSQTLDQWLTYREVELEALGMEPDNGLPAFERALVAALRTDDHPKARTFAEKAAAIQAAKKRKTPAHVITAEEIIWNIRQLKNEHQGVQRRTETQDLVRKTRELNKRAEQLARNEQLAWEGDRQPLDQNGNPVKYQSAHGQVVDDIEAIRREKEAKGDKFHLRTDRFETSFFRFLETTDILGPGVHIEAHPTAKYDDYGNHIDAVLHIDLPLPDGQSKRITLGVDFTISAKEDVLAEKLHYTTSGPFRSLDYNTNNLRRGTKCIRAVLAIDETRMERIRDGYYLEKAAAEKGYQNLSTLEQRQAQSRRLRDDKVCNWMVVDGLLMQLKEQLQELTTRGSVAREGQDLLLLIEHLTKLRTENKDLRRDAVAEVNNEMSKREIGATYRIADPKFVHEARVNYRPSAAGDERHSATP